MTIKKTNFSKQLNTKNLFKSKRALTGGTIFISKGHLMKSLCWDTLLSEINMRLGFELIEYGSYYLVLCNSGKGIPISTSPAISPSI